ncbi:hypothetical protein GGS23DRAFT_163400 [Durotheca rogersii]|uniref:uncharacterized protein n=1 Tax=Durotheca rogersii TaxID=419775 RepID=UPI00221F4ADC|nr:uncharacterized protein GGS23DRAFT_163400 [Durotheca rogersii]KAI5867150.1 hypothetical protein GGS23DRAFT_163400 [Durotheca rogersii]
MQRPNHKSKSSRPWSEPKWNDQYQQWYSERVGRHGTVEYDWIGPTLPDAHDQSIPRSDQTIDNLTEGVGHLSVGQNVYAESFEYGGHHHPTVEHTSYTLDTHQTQEPSYLDNPQAQQHSDKGKGKSVAVGSVEEYGRPSLDSNLPQATDGLGLASNGYIPETHSQYIEPNYQGIGNTTTTTTSPFSNIADPHANVYGSEGAQHSYNETEYEEAIRRSHNEYYGTKKTGEASYSTALEDAAAPPSWAPSVDPNAYELGSAQPDAVGSPPTPRSGSPIAPLYPNYIQGTPGEEETVDSRYRVERSTRFQPGEVFKILWSEPRGQVGGDDPISDVTKMNIAGGGRFYIGFRRFIIVTTDESHHSTCVPILTYDRRGCLKKGVRPSKHGIIYMAGQKPRLLKNEPQLGFEPVALQVYAEGEKLARESRVNYSKLVTIEHNVKVFFIGSITGDEFEKVRCAVNECWDKKMHRSSRKSRR